MDTVSFILGRILIFPFSTTICPVPKHFIHTVPGSLGAADRLLKYFERTDNYITRAKIQFLILEISFRIQIINN
jgi:hypothetical protein